MPSTLIIGYGNPLRCDDGLAWRVAQDYLSQNHNHDDVEVITCHQLTPELSFSVSQASKVLFVDAARDGSPGEIRCASVTPQPVSSAFSHTFTPDAILSVSKELYGKSPEAFIISISGECFDHGERISPSVSQCLPAVGTLIRSLVCPLRTSHTA